MTPNGVLFYSQIRETSCCRRELIQRPTTGKCEQRGFEALITNWDVASKALPSVFRILQNRGKRDGGRLQGSSPIQTHRACQPSELPDAETRHGEGQVDTSPAPNQAVLCN